MGAENTTYVGIYLELDYVKTTITESKYVHPETGKTQKHRFDQDTGRENFKKDFSRIEYYEPSSYVVGIDDLIEDEFFTPAYTGGGKRIQTFIPSSGKYGNKVDEIGNYEIKYGDDIDQLVKEFKIKYKKYLDYYENEYGPVTVKFGVVNYAH